MSVKLNEKTYDILKWIAMYLLPALGTLYFALSGIWGLPYGEQIVGTVTAIDTFLAVILGLSKGGYEGDGTITINTSNVDKDVMQLDFNIEDPIDLAKGRKYITFKVNYTEDPTMDYNDH